MLERRQRDDPSEQWVLLRLPRNPATMGDEDECLDVGALQAYADGPTTFGVQSRHRAKAREAFVRWDCGERVRYAALRRAAPVVGSYQVGDTVSYCREARAGKHVLQWSVEDRNSLGETQPRTCWILCDSVPVCVAVDRSTMHTSGTVGWLFITHKPKVLHLLGRTLTYNKASSMNVLHSILRLPIRHRLPMKVRMKTSGTTKCHCQHEQTEQKSENRFRRTKQQNLSVTREFIGTF